MFCKQFAKRSDVLDYLIEYYKILTLPLDIQDKGVVNQSVEVFKEVQARRFIK